MYTAVSFSTIQNYKNQKHFENFKKSYGKNEHTPQRMHVQNHAYANKSRCMYVCDIYQLLNPDKCDLQWMVHYITKSRGISKDPCHI